MKRLISVWVNCALMSGAWALEECPPVSDQPEGLEIRPEEVISKKVTIANGRRITLEKIDPKMPPAM